MKHNLDQAKHVFNSRFILETTVVNRHQPSKQTKHSLGSSLGGRCCCDVGHLGCFKFLCDVCLIFGFQDGNIVWQRSLGSVLVVGIPRQHDLNLNTKYSYNNKDDQKDSSQVNIMHNKLPWRSKTCLTAVSTQTLVGSPLWIIKPSTNFMLLAR